MTKCHSCRDDQIYFLSNVLCWSILLKTIFYLSHNFIPPITSQLNSCIWYYYKRSYHRGTSHALSQKKEAPPMQSKNKKYVWMQTITSTISPSNLSLLLQPPRLGITTLATHPLPSFIICHLAHHLFLVKCPNFDLLMFGNYAYYIIFVDHLL